MKQRIMAVQFSIKNRDSKIDIQIQISKTFLLSYLQTLSIMDPILLFASS